MLKQWKHNEFEKILKKNGFLYDRGKGSHSIFKNGDGRHISVPKSMNAVIIERLIKENNLIIK